MRNSSARLKSDMELIESDGFIKQCRFLKQTHFTRNRKMPLHKVILTTLFRKGRSLKMELKDFAKKFRMAEISKAGYLKQRMKLNPQAFLELARFHAKQFYRNKISLKTFKGYLILSCDGSDLSIPSTPENQELFHKSSRSEACPRPQAGLSCLFDVLNRQICDCTASYSKPRERSEALSHIKKRRNYRR